MPTNVQVNTYTYATTHVATNLILGLKLLVMACGLDLAKLIGDWITLERGVETWLGTGHLKQLVLEIYCPTTNLLVKRFDFDIDYEYHPNGDGVLWIDRDTVKYALHKAGTVPCDNLYDILAQTAVGRPEVEGWHSGNFRSTAHLRRRSVGAAIGGGNLGAPLNYWREDK